MNKPMPMENVDKILALMYNVAKDINTIKLDHQGKTRSLKAFIDKNHEKIRDVVSMRRTTTKKQL